MNNKVENYDFLNGIGEIVEVKTFENAVESADEFYDAEGFVITEDVEKVDNECHFWNEYPESEDEYYDDDSFVCTEEGNEADEFYDELINEDGEISAE